MMGRAVGTPAFMSPEQAAGRHDLLGPASDVYCLGATLFALLTGKAPFAADGDVLTRVQQGSFPPPRQLRPQIHPALEAICLKAMALRPADRYQTVAELGKDIERWLDDQPVSAWPEPWSVRARRWISRHRTLVTASASALAVALVGLAVVAVLILSANQQRAARGEYLNKEVGAALEETAGKRREIHAKLEAPLLAQELVSNIDQWGTMLQRARAAWQRACALRKGTASSRTRRWPRSCANSNRDWLTTTRTGR